MGSQEILILRIRVDLRVTEIKEYCTLPRSPELEPHLQTKHDQEILIDNKIEREGVRR